MRDGEMERTYPCAVLVIAPLKLCRKPPMTDGEAMGTQAQPTPEKPSPCIARQPILAADESVIGYELLFRHNADERHFTAGTRHINRKGENRKARAQSLKPKAYSRLFRRLPFAAAAGFAGTSPGASTRRTMGVFNLYFRSTTFPLSSFTRRMKTGRSPSFPKSSWVTVTGNTPFRLRSRYAVS